MVNVALLNDTIIVTRHMTIGEVIEKAGFTKRVWYNRIERKIFYSNEIKKLIEILSLSMDEVYAIFFAD